MKSSEFSQKFHEAEHKAWKYPGHVYTTISDHPEPKIYIVSNGKYMNVSLIESDRGNVLIHVLESE